MLEFHEVANIFPLMPESELSILAQDILTNGLIHPITLYENKILDGRNRYLACLKVNIEPLFKEWTGESPTAYVLSENLKRRQLGASQRATIGVEAEIWFAKEAKERQLAGVNLKAILPEGYKGQARDEAGKAVGVSGRYISEAKQIKEKDPELFEKIKTGEIDLQGAKRQIRTEEIANTRAEIAEAGQRVKPSDRWNVFIGDIKTWQAPRQYDFIITDPPYPKEYLPFYEVLSLRAAELLKDGGLLIAMCGQSYLDDIYNLLGKHLTYYWTACYLTPGQPTPLRQVNVNTTWKPLLIYRKGDYKGKIFGDVFKSNSNDKSYHKWGQSESGMFDIISKICLPGQYIFDPFCGAGTTGIATLKHDCFFDGLDVDEANVNITKGRLNDTAEKR